MLFDTFKDTIFLKESTELEKKCNALNKLCKEYPDNQSLLEEYFINKKGLIGENEIKYQLEKSNLGLYVLRDINLKYENLSAQIDFVIITKVYCYFIECKNLIGNITINNDGDFIREYIFDGKKYKKGMYSPLRQVEAQRDVYKKIWNNQLSSNKLVNLLRRTLSEKNFTDTYRVLVVAANHEGLLNKKYAPIDIKDKVIRADKLIQKLKEDLDKSDKTLWESKKSMEEWANSFLNINKELNIDYYEYYKNKFININKVSDEELINKLIEFRKKRSAEMGIPPYYIYNNEEMKRLVSKRPKSVNELKSTNLILPIKVKTHGEEIVKIIND